jgi:hypothetical protein
LIPQPVDIFAAAHATLQLAEEVFAKTGIFRSLRKTGSRPIFFEKRSE